MMANRIVSATFLMPRLIMLTPWPTKADKIEVTNGLRNSGSKTSRGLKTDWAYFSKAKRSMDEKLFQKTSKVPRTIDSYSVFFIFSKVFSAAAFSVAALFHSTFCFVVVVFLLLHFRPLAPKVLRANWGRFGDALGTFWGRFEDALGTLWGRFGTL